MMSEQAPHRGSPTATCTRSRSRFITDSVQQQSTSDDELQRREQRAGSPLVVADQPRPTPYNAGPGRGSRRSSLDLEASEVMVDDGVGDGSQEHDGDDAVVYVAQFRSKEHDGDDAVIYVAQFRSKDGDASEDVQGEGNGTLPTYQVQQGTKFSETRGSLKQSVPKTSPITKKSPLQKDVISSAPLVQHLKPEHTKCRHSSSSSDSGTGVCSSFGSSESDHIKELYGEINGLRIRVKGVETLGDILNETRQDNQTLMTKNNALEKAISNLQSRLRSLGCDTSVNLAKDEIFIPGHDRSFVNGLISENGRLLKELRELNLKGNQEDPAKTNTKLGKSVVELERFITTLQDELRRKTVRISELQDLVQSSDDAKTAKIAHLQDVCVLANKDLKEAEKMCGILTSETKQLQNSLATTKKQLDQTVKDGDHWKERAKDLESQARIAFNQRVAPHSKSNLNIADRLKIAEGQVEQLDTENGRMTDQLREVIAMNTRWQRYNEQREAHVLKMTKGSQQQKSKLTVLERERGDLEQTINGLNTLLQKQQDDARTKTDVAVLSLEQQLTQREDRILELVEEVAALKMHIRNYESVKGFSQRREDKETIETLNHQVKIYQDDFNQERKDRERVQGNNEILRHRLQDALKKLAAVDTRTQKALFQPFPTRMTNSPSPYDQPGKFVARGISRPYSVPDDDYTLPYDVEVDGQDQTDGYLAGTGGQSSDEMLPDGLGSDTEPLECPRCARKFTVTDHTAFMRHVGVCLDQ